MYKYVRHMLDMYIYIHISKLPSKAQTKTHGGRPRLGEVEVQDVGGPLCFAGDVVAKDVEAPRIYGEDVVVPWTSLGKPEPFPFLEGVESVLFGLAFHPPPPQSAAPSVHLASRKDKKVYHIFVVWKVSRDLSFWLEGILVCFCFLEGGLEHLLFPGRFPRKIVFVFCFPFLFLFRTVSRMCFFCLRFPRTCPPLGTSNGEPFGRRFSNIG